MSAPWGTSSYVSAAPTPAPPRGGTIWVVVACLSPFLGSLALVSTLSGVDALLWIMVLVELAAGVFVGLSDGRARQGFAHGRVFPVVVVLMCAMFFLVGYAIGYGIGHRMATPAERARKDAPAQVTPAGTILGSQNPYLAAVSYAYHDPNGGGGFLGWEGQHMLTAPPRQALLVIGPPGSSKTTSIIIPSILVAPGACVTTSPKAELLLGTYWIRSLLGRSWQFDPSTDQPYAEGVAVARWSPLVGVHDWDSANRRAGSMAEPYLKASEGGNGAHFIRTAKEIVGVLFYAAVLAGEGMGKVYSWVSTLTTAQTQTDVLTIFFEHEDGDPGASVAADKAKGHFAMGIEELSKYVSSTAEVLEAYKFMSVQRVSDRPNFDPRQFVRSRDTLHICVPDEYQEAFAPVVTGLIEAIKNAAYELHDRRTKGLEPQGPHVTFVLDEVTNIAPIPLPRLVSQSGGQGLHIIAAMQSNTQAIDRWGNSARDLISLFPYKVILRGVTDMNVLEPLSSIAGNQDRVVQGYSESTSYVGRYNMPIRQQNPNWSVQRQRILEHSHISNPPQGYAVMFQLSDWKLIQLSPVFDPFWKTVLATSPYPPLDSSQPLALDDAPPAYYDGTIGSALRIAIDHQRTRAQPQTSPQPGGEPEKEKDE